MSTQVELVAGVAFAAGLLITARVRANARETLRVTTGAYEAKLKVERDATSMAAEQLLAAHKLIASLREELSQSETALREASAQHEASQREVQAAEAEKLRALAYAAGCVAGAGAQSQPCRPKLSDVSNLLALKSD